MPETTTVSTPAVAAGTAPAAVGKTPAAKTPETTAKTGTGAQAVKPGETAPVAATGRAARLAAIAKANATDAAKASGKPATEDKPVTVTDTNDKLERKAPDATGYSTARIAELEAENATLKSSGRDSLLAELKENPGKLFKLLKLDGDKDLLTALAEAKAKGDDPNEVLQEAIKNAVKPLEEKLKAGDEEKAKANADRVAAEVLGATRQLFADGYKEGDETIADPGVWKLSAKLTKANVIDAPAEAYASMRKMVADIQGKLKAAGKPAKAFTNREAAVMLAVSFDAIEKREAARAVHYLNDVTNVNLPNGKGEKIIRKGISSKIGYGQTTGRSEANTPAPRNKFERRQQRLDRIKTGN